jgi:ABC-type transporter Mla MlaB component
MSTKTKKRRRTDGSSPEAPTVDEHALSAAAASDSAPVSAPAEPTIVLSAVCTVKDGEALKGELLRHIGEPASVAIDAGSVERIDTAAMQLLCAFVRDRTDRSLQVTWRSVSQSVSEAARLLGVGSMLALPAEAAP